MNYCLHENFLLTTPLARDLYHGTARDLPLVDYHCHLSPALLATDHIYQNLSELWLACDPYKHRAMRIAGVAEKYITGASADHVKFTHWAATLPLTLGNPLHAWSALELCRNFDIDTPLSPASADSIWHAANHLLRTSPRHTIRGLLERNNVTCLSTSDRLLDDLSHHATLARCENWRTRALPSLRADDILAIDSPGYHDWLACLASSTATVPAITAFDEFHAAITARLDAFDALGCRLADHSYCDFRYIHSAPSGLPALFDRFLGRTPLDAGEIVRLQSALTLYLALEYKKRGWILQLHLGAQRHTSARLRRLAGSAGGYATIGNTTDISQLCAFFDDLESHGGGLPRTVLYPLNPADMIPFAAITGSFCSDSEPATPGLLQLGPAWWFNDHLHGIRDHLDALSAHGLLSTFIGMNTDSRSPLSQSRHEYFRRVLCGWLGERAATGQFPSGASELAPLVHAICHGNAARALNLPTTAS